MGDLNFNILICLLDEFNGSNIFAIRNLNPKKVVFIYEDKAKLEDLFEDIKEYIWEFSPFTNVEGENLNNVSYENLCRIMLRYPKKSTLVNLCGGEKLTNLLVFKICIAEHIKVVFTDLEKEEIIEIGSSTINSLELKSEELDVKDFIASSGGEINLESTRLFEDKNIQASIDFIISHYEVWVKLKSCLRAAYAICYSQEDPCEVTINLSLIRDSSKYKIFIDKALELDLFKIKYKDCSRIVLKFNNMEYKTFIFKSGTWLEVLVYRLIKDLKGIDDVRAGVLFQWDNDDNRVKNEADVLVSASGELTYISCKDTSKYDEAALNEIEVYAKQIGGDNVKKVLVATLESYKEVTVLRASEMGIRIVLFDGDIKKTQQKLHNIIFG